MCTVHGLGSASPPVVLCLRQENFELLNRPRTFSIRRMESYFGWSMMILGGEDDFNGW